MPAIMGPAINRWPFSNIMRLPGTIPIILALPLLVAFYDFWSLRRVHYTAIVGTSLIAISAFTLIPATHLATWHRLDPSHLTSGGIPKGLEGVPAGMDVSSIGFRNQSNVVSLLLRVINARRFILRSD
jgi:hypothetical protein